MSAFIVSKEHIDALVTAAAEYKIIPASLNEANELGAMLWAENYHSVNTRYPGHEEIPPVYKFHKYLVSLSPVALVKQIQCYEYQACESEDFDSTPAHALCVKLLAKLATEMAHASPDYDAAPWGV